MGGSAELTAEASKDWDSLNDGQKEIARARRRATSWGLPKHEDVKADEELGKVAVAVPAPGADDEEELAHIKDFTAFTGMTPRACYRLVVLCMMLRGIGGTWMSMVMLEYTRYYVINDLNIISAIETATGSPQSLLKAFLFPFWGILADRASRKKMLVAGSLATCASAWLLTLAPSIATLVVVRALSLVGDVRGSIEDAMLRDLFSTRQWEQLEGGVTGIKSRLSVIWTLTSAGAVLIGMALLKLGDMGYTGMADEYTVAGQCSGLKYCEVPRGWHVGGSLRLLMLMGTIAVSLESLVLVFLFPETLRHRTEASVLAFIRHRFAELGTPWNNLRVFCTKQLQALLEIRVIHYVIGSGGTAIFMSWYRRNHLDTFTMYTMGAVGGVAGFVVMLCVIRLVKRFGDVKGIWIPANAIALLYGVSVVMTPASQWYLGYLFFPLFGGPSATLAGFTPDLLSKLIPPDVQATFQTGKGFLYDVQRAVMVWPWLGLYVWSESFPEPFDGLAIWVAVGLGVVALWLTVKELPRDPKEAICQGKALEPFWDTPYVKGKWYRRHGGRMAQGMPGASSPGASSPHDMAGGVAAAEGASKAGLVLADVNDASLPAYLQFLATNLPKKRSVSVVLSFLEPPELSPPGQASHGTLPPVAEEASADAGAAVAASDAPPADARSSSSGSPAAAGAELAAAGADQEAPLPPLATAAPAVPSTEAAVATEPGPDITLPVEIEELYI